MRASGALGASAICLDDGSEKSTYCRSRGAALDADIGRLKREASRLEREAKAVRVEMKADLEEIQLLERDADRFEAEAARATRPSRRSRPRRSSERNAARPRGKRLGDARMS